MHPTEVLSQLQRAAQAGSLPSRLTAAAWQLTRPHVWCHLCGSFLSSRFTACNPRVHTLSSNGRPHPHGPLPRFLSANREAHPRPHPRFSLIPSACLAYYCAPTWSCTELISPSLAGWLCHHSARVAGRLCRRCVAPAWCELASFAPCGHWHAWLPPDNVSMQVGLL